MYYLAELGSRRTLRRHEKVTINRYNGFNASRRLQKIIAGVGTPAEHVLQTKTEEPTNIVTIYPESSEYPLADPKLIVASPSSLEEVNAALKKVEETE